jgi:NADH dehydrogenase (ubiquinone) Fe-S protein 1
VIELLLINHPLDCPVCDQAGECDLQDQTLVFGGDKGRYYEFKRAVKNKNFGTFIKTSMNRCIHCTKCVRFTNELGGFSSLGLLGRGNTLEIGSYVTNLFDANDELIANIIDLCPVGALTAKSSAFKARM